ncbi:transcriptional regulator [Streptomyces sp. VRA16 Mangrove soil]|uniref:transcriptional regulator n=1 Tax=Streptomyces sp. VRA16 Mangrove soil TaxID=2817434 RepID=UPI001A9E7768|nr:transcriptional regulator [Streptomyces sp. VRA16 Mangrove soil]MBO1332575.1 transcriptional regulator [Streptomyces sp. VRA16 Mangrove soil]
MPDRNHEFGKFGAQGIKGYEAAARQLDNLVDFIATPVTQRRGMLARLNYLTRTEHAKAAARAAGLTVSDRTLKRWAERNTTPSKKSLAQLEAAYRQVRRHNVARHLLQRLNKDGRGTRVEFHPLNQSQVPRPHVREVSFRTLNVRHWDRMVEAWAAGDDDAMDQAWFSDITADLGSDYGAYEYVMNIGFAA